MGLSHMHTYNVWLIMLKQTRDSKWVMVLLQKMRNWYQHLICSYMPEHKSLNQDKGGKYSLAAWIGESNHFRCRIVAESRSKITLTRRHFSLFVHFSFDEMKWEWWTCQSEKLLHLQYLSEISLLLSSSLFRKYPYLVFQSTTIHQIPVFCVIPAPNNLIPV